MSSWPNDKLNGKKNRNAKLNSAQAKRLTLRWYTALLRTPSLIGSCRVLAGRTPSKSRRKKESAPRLLGAPMRGLRGYRLDNTIRAPSFRSCTWEWTLSPGKLSFYSQSLPFPSTTHHGGQTLGTRARRQHPCSRRTEFRRGGQEL
jgi:hypothetical protein